MENLQKLLSFKFTKLYFLAAIIGSLIIRAIVGFYLSKERDPPINGSFAKYFRGKPIMNPDRPSEQIRSGDNYLGFFIGFFELLSYPILISTNNPIIIGSWLLFKTIHRTKYNPDEKRGLYNRYLFANALILLFSYLMCRWLI